jgi:hypothetical protein
VHGHDFTCVASIPVADGGARYAYASGAEEKMIRVFEAPAAFLDTLAMARGEALQREGPNGAKARRNPAHRSLGLAGSMPANSPLAVLVAESFSNAPVCRSFEPSKALWALFFGVPQAAGFPLGAAVAALGLSNKAVFANDKPNGGVGSGASGGGYAEGPDVAPNASPSATAGDVPL